MLFHQGGNCTDHSTRYSCRQTVIVESFISYLDKVEAYRELSARVENPFRIGMLSEEYLSLIPKVFVEIN